ncbi:MAG: MFS transporter [Hyphomonadaceae bacterium]
MWLWRSKKGYALAPSAQTASPSIGHAWYVVALLVLLYAISFIDRYALSLLTAPITRELAISDVQMGALFGLGFGVVYAVTGLPLAHLIDRKKRVPLLAAGVVIWGICTVLSAFASGFYSLLACRSGVAVGEAVLSPAAISMIGDMFTRDRRNLPTTVYTTTSVFMQSGAFIVGGMAIQIATVYSAALNLAPWRLTLIFLGAPAIIAGVVFYLTVREPARTQEPTQTADFGTMAQAVAYIWRERSLFGWTFVALAMMGICGGGVVAWTPTLLERNFAASTADAGYLYGVVGTVAAIMGALAFPVANKLWSKRRKDALILLLAFGLALPPLGAAMIGLASSVFWVLAGVAIVMIGYGAAGQLPPLLVQSVAPSRMRARLSALNLMAMSLVGLAFGPPLSAALGGWFFTGASALGYGMAAVSVVGLPATFIGMLLARKRYVAALAEAESREGSAQQLPQAAAESSVPASP